MSISPPFVCVWVQQRPRPAASLREPGIYEQFLRLFRKVMGFGGQSTPTLQLFPSSLILFAGDERFLFLSSCVTSKGVETGRYFYLCILDLRQENAGLGVSA